jgi:hypothetical protein
MLKQITTILSALLIALAPAPQAIAHEFIAFKENYEAYACAKDRRWLVYATAEDAKAQRDPIAYMPPEYCMRVDIARRESTDQIDYTGGAMPVTDQHGVSGWVWATPDEWLKMLDALVEAGDRSSDSPHPHRSVDR